MEKKENENQRHLLNESIIVILLLLPIFTFMLLP